MKTKGKIIISVVSVFLALVIAFGAFAIAKHRKEVKKLGMNDYVPYGFGQEATVVLLAGQSNASGCSRDDYLKKNVSEKQYAEYEKGYKRVYINHFVSANNLSYGFEHCTVRQGEFDQFFGPELGMAEKFHELYPRKKIFIIKYAWGGTNLYEQWLSPSSGKEAGVLYKGLIEFVKSSVAYLTAKNYKVKIEALCWMQGESDCDNESVALDYEKNLTNFIKDVRAELAQYASNDGIAFVDAYIAESIFWTPNCYIVNNAKTAVANASPMNVVIDTKAHGLTVANEPEWEPDLAHFDSMSELKLGNLFAEQCNNFFD